MARHIRKKSLNVWCLPTSRQHERRMCNTRERGRRYRWRIESTRRLPGRSQIVEPARPVGRTRHSDQERGHLPHRSSNLRGYRRGADSRRSRSGLPARPNAKRFPVASGAKYTYGDSLGDIDLVAICDGALVLAECKEKEETHAEADDWENSVWPQSVKLIDAAKVCRADLVVLASLAAAYPSDWEARCAICGWRHHRGAASEPSRPRVWLPQTAIRGKASWSATLRQRCCSTVLKAATYIRPDSLGRQCRQPESRTRCSDRPDFAELPSQASPLHAYRVFSRKATTVVVP